MRRNPPRLATALLKRLSDNDALAGDLREAYASGRSRVWYWRQVLTAIRTSVVHTSSTEPPRTISAVLFGVMCVWIVTFYFPVLPRFDEWLFVRGVTSWFYMNHIGFSQWAMARGFPAVAISKGIAFGLASYGMANIDRRAALPFALTIALGNLAVFVEYGLGVRYPITQLVTDLIVLYPLAAFVGAFAGSGRRELRRISE